VLGLHRLDALIWPAGDTPSLPERLLSRLAVTYRIGERDLHQIPRSGPVVIVANHPFGILEGAVLATVLARVRPDVRFLANDLLSHLGSNPAGSASHSLEFQMYGSVSFEW